MYEQLPLRFGFRDLEPHIAESVLQRHHGLHHAGYVARLNTALAAYPELQGMTIEKLLATMPSLPAETRARLEDVAGGHANHQFQWKVIGPAAGGVPVGELAAAIERGFGSFAGFRDAFTAAALAHVGSGWAFLSNSRLGSSDLEILVLPNNASVLPLGRPGVLICDLWEHAHEAQYPAARADYLDAYFRVLDWDVCNTRFESFAAGRMHPG